MLPEVLFCFTEVDGSAKSDTKDFVSNLNGLDIRSRVDTDDLSHNFILDLVRKLASDLNANSSGNRMTNNAKNDEQKGKLAK